MLTCDLPGCYLYIEYDLQTLAPKTITREALKMRISEIEWNGGQGLQDLSIHGIGPTKAIAEHLAGILEEPRPNDGPETREAIPGTVIQRLEDVEQSLERFAYNLCKENQNANIQKC
jgi:hypothetical protein